MFLEERDVGFTSSLSSRGSFISWYLGKSYTQWGRQKADGCMGANFNHFCKCPVCNMALCAAINRQKKNPGSLFFIQSESSKWVIPESLMLPLNIQYILVPSEIVHHQSTPTYSPNISGSTQTAWCSFCSSDQNSLWWTIKYPSHLEHMSVGHEI